MRIAAVQHAVPTRRITNDWILERIREYNRPRMTSLQFEATEQRVRQMLESSGTEVRYRLNEGEKAFDFGVEAARQALDAASVRPQDVDLLIYAGVVRGWLEPATANLFQGALGMANATCFDILDACASWLRALQVAHSYLRSGISRCAMIVNCEHVFSDCYECWDLSAEGAATCRSAIYTLGDASTATVLVKEPSDDDFYFTFKNFGEHFSLCMVPLSNVHEFAALPASDHYAPMKLFSSSRELFRITVDKIIDTFESDPNLRSQRYDIGFGHQASEKASKLIARKLGLPYDDYFTTHREYGNTVAASVPLGMSLALRDGRLKRGDRVLVIVGSAGITVGFAAFTF